MPVWMPEDDMPNWWLIWAEHLAKVLADWWVRAGSTEPGDDSLDVEARESRRADHRHPPAGDDDG